MLSDATPETLAPAVKGPSSGNPAARRVRFSTITTYLFSSIVDGSKLPGSGCAPIGLGEPIGEAEPEHVDVFEGRRAMLRRPAEQLLLNHGARLALLDGVDLKELKALEEENAAILDAEANTRPVMGGAGSHTVLSDDLNGLLAEAGATGTVEAIATAMDGYSTAEAGDARAGVGHGFEERQTEEEVRRKRRLEDEKAATQARKVEKRRCAGCKRFACIC